MGPIGPREAGYRRWGRQRVEQDYASERMVRETQDLYQQVLAQKERR